MCIRDSSHTEFVSLPQSEEGEVVEQCATDVSRNDLKNGDKSVQKDVEQRVENQEFTDVKRDEVREKKSEEYLGEIDDFEIYCEEEDYENDSVNTALLASTMASESDPETYKEAINSPEREKWVEAMREELKSHEKCKTWNIIPLIELPKNASIVKAQWIFRKKIGTEGKIIYKAKLVAKGFADKNIYSRDEIYAPVARISDVRLILCISNKLNLELAQLDVKTAFLKGSLEKPVYMKISDLTDSEVPPNSICELKQSIYGLKVSPKRWYV